MLASLVNDFWDEKIMLEIYRSEDLRPAIFHTLLELLDIPAEFN